MKKLLSLSILFLCLFMVTSCFSQQKDIPWNAEQLKAPAELAAELKLPKDQRPVVFDIGPAGVIKGAIEVGPAEYEENMTRLKTFLKDIPRDKEVVIYCGCCPFSRCPNVRPAFKALLDMGFKKPRLLNLSQNLKADWIDQGFPLKEE